MSTFDEARLAAVAQDLLAGLLGRPSDLLAFDDVKEQLKLRHIVDRGVQEVPLDAIAGTLGRGRDFNRGFLPREDALRSRWLEIRALARGPRGFPPIELYQVGDAYFVVDGHHRVSVARAEGAKVIEARVREFLTPVPLGPDESLEDVIDKRGLADFLEATGLTPGHPDEYRTTVHDGYERLLDHIATHRCYLGLEQQREVPWDEAVASWREKFYAPVTERIRQSGLLADMPSSTEADLYLYAMEELHYLRERYGADAVPPARAADHFAELQRQMTGGPLDRFRRWLRSLRRHRGA